MTKKLWMMSLLLFGFPLVVLAQTSEVYIDISKAEAIFLGGIAGFSVVAITELLKRFLKTHGIATVVISIVVSAAATVYYLFTANGGFNLLKFIIYTAVVALAANGIYLFPRSRAS